VWVMSAGDHRWVNGLFITDPLCLIFLALLELSIAGLPSLAQGTSAEPDQAMPLVPHTQRSTDPAELKAFLDEFLAVKWRNITFPVAIA